MGKLLIFFICLFAQFTALFSKNLYFDPKEDIESHFPQTIHLVKEVIQNSLTVRRNKASIEEAQSIVMIANSHSGFKTYLNMNTQSVHENRPEVGYSHRYRTYGSVSVRKPIYHWGALKAQSRIAELSYEFAIQNSRYSKSELVVNIKSEFMNLVLLSLELEEAKKNLEVRQIHEKHTKKKNELGRVTDLQLSEATILKLDQTLRVSELERILQTQLSNFIYDTGYKEKLILKIPEKLTKFCLSHQFGENIPQLIGSISSNRINQLTSNIKKEKNNIEISDAANKPKFNLIGGFFQDQIDLADNTKPVRRNNLLIGIEANWELWDASRAKGEKSLAITRKRKWEMELENISRKLRFEIDDLQKQLYNLKSQIELSKELISAAKNRLERSLIELNAKRITPVKHFEAEIVYSNSNINLIKNVFNYMKIKSRYELILNQPNS